MESEQKDVAFSTEDSEPVSMDARLKDLLRPWGVCLLLALVARAVVGWLQTPPMVPDDYVFEPVALQITGQVVDEEGQPVADAVIQTAGWFDEPVSTTSDASGFYKLTCTDLPGRAVLTASAKADNGDILRGGSRLAWPVPAGDTRITVMPERAIPVRVIDADGTPLRDVTVRAMSPRDIGHVTTDSTGKAILRLPANIEPYWIVAFRSGVGLDYYENYQTRPGTSVPPLPEVVELRLTGTKRVKVEVVDSDGNPVSGVRITPWALKATHKRDSLNSFCDILAVSDVNGIAECEIPLNLERDPMFEVVDFRRWWLIRDFSGTTSNPPIVRLKRTALVRGRVIHSDGSPAGGVQVQGEGVSDNHDSFRSFTQTRPDGSWELWVAPHQTYMFGVNDSEWACQPADGLSFVENELREDVTLQLTSGTLVHGRITQGDEDSSVPAPMKTVRLSREGSIHGFLRSSGGERVINASLHRFGVTDEDGKYSFRVADGAYELHLPVEPATAVPVSIAGEAEIIHNGHTTSEHSTIRMAGLVSETSGQPASHAVVWCSRRGVQWQEVQVPAGDDGRYWLERTEEPTLIYARNEDGTEATFTKVAAVDAVADFTLAPAAQLVGTVRKLNGDVAPGCTVRAIIRHPAQLMQSGVAIADEIFTVDGQGRFVVKGLPPGAQVQLLAWPDGTDGEPAHGQVTVNGTGTVQAPDVKPRVRRQPWPNIF